MALDEVPEEGRMKYKQAEVFYQKKAALAQDPQANIKETSVFLFQPILAGTSVPKSTFLGGP